MILTLININDGTERNFHDVMYGREFTGIEGERRFGWWRSGNPWGMSFSLDFLQKRFTHGILWSVDFGKINIIWELNK